MCEELCYGALMITIFIIYVIFQISTAIYEDLAENFENPVGNYRNRGPEIQLKKLPIENFDPDFVESCKYLIFFSLLVLRYFVGWLPGPIENLFLRLSSWAGVFLLGAFMLLNFCEPN